MKYSSGFAVLLALALIAVPVMAQAGHPVITAGNAAQVTQLDIANQETIDKVVWSPDGSTLAAVSKIGLLLYDPTDLSLKPVTIDGLPSAVSSAAYSPDGSVLAVGGCSDMGDQGCPEGAIWLWDIQANTARAVLKHAINWPTDLAYTPDGKSLIAVDYPHKVYIWDTEQGTLAHTILFEGANSAALSPDGTILAVGSDNGTVALFDVASGDQITTLGKHDYVSRSSLAYSPDGTKIAAGYDNGTLRIWDAKTYDQIGEFDSKTGSVLSLAFSADSSLLAAGTDKLVHLWDVATGEDLNSLGGHTRMVTASAFSPDGTILATGTWSDIRLWGVP